MSRVKGTNVTGAPIELTSGAPVDAKMLVDTKADLYNASTWQAPSAAGANAGKMFCYYGMLVYVGNDAEHPENNGLYVLQNSGANDANADATANSGANWVRISQTDTRINAIESDIDSIQSELENIPTADNVVLKTDISTVIPEEGAVDTKVASEKAVADAIGNFIETGSSARLTTLTIGNGTGAATVTLDTTNGITGSVIDETLPSSTGNAGRIPSTNAVVTAINEVKSSISGVYTYKGSVASYDALPDDAEVGDVYNVEAAYGNYPAGTNYAWDGTKWDALGGSVDLSAYQTKNDNSLTTAAKTVVGAINELDGEVATNTANIGTLQTTVGNSESGLVKDVADNTAAIGTLQTSLAGKQDATISVNIQGEAKTTIPDALTSLDTALTAVKTTADGAAKVDASNIVPATWKGVLGYQSASDVSAAVIAGVTTNTYDDNLDTTAKTIVGAINEVNTTLSNKQNKLLYYSETSGDTPSATISVANIKFKGSVAEGTGTTASGPGSHAEGDSTTSSGASSHAEGTGTRASGTCSHAEGIETTASGASSHAEGYFTKASSDYQHVQGKLNIEDANDKYADIIGNGTSTSARSNAATVSWDGISWSQTDVRAGGTDQDAATHSLAAKQNATDNSLETTDKTIVGAINELSADKQNTLKYYSESDSSTEPSSNNAQVSILGSSDYQTTLNLGFESSNGIQTVNIGGSSNDRRINIGTKVCGENNNVTIGNASDGVSLTINAQRALTLNTSENSDLQGTGIAKEVAEAPTNRKLTTEKAVAYNTSFKKEINKIYFNSGKINNDVFQLPKFPFTICVTCKVDSWFFDGKENGQSLFQFGNGYQVTTSPWGALYFRDNTDNPKVALYIVGSTTGIEVYRSEYFASLGNIDDFLGKKHTIVAIARDPGDNPTRPNWNIYLDGVELTTITGAYNSFNENDTPLDVPTHFVVNVDNPNYYNSTASANPLEIYDISLFDFDLSEEGSAYSVLDYANGKLIPPELYVEDLRSDANKLWFKVDPQIYEFGGKRILKDLSLHGFDCYVSTVDTTVATDADAAYNTLMSKVDDHLTTSWIDKKASPQLYLERGVLSVPELANYPLKWPLTLAIEYELESLQVGPGTNYGCFLFNYWDVEESSPAQHKGFLLEITNSRRLYLYLGHPNDIVSTEEFEVYTTNGGKGLPTGRHTIVVCIDGDVVDGGPGYLRMYLDGNELDTTVVTKTLSGNDLTGTRPLSICSANNYANPSLATGGVLLPISIARPYIFNFRIDDNYAPYTLEDYVKGVCLPAEVTLGDPNFTFGSIYGNGWSTTDNGTKITVTSANTTWPALFTNVVPRGYCWKSVLDVNLTFSGKTVFEIYTQCKKAYIEVYDYSTGVTTLFSSAGREGGWGGGNPFGLSSSGHYKITIYGHCSIGVRVATFAIGPLSSGTITRTEANLQYTILAPESYTVTEYDQVDIASPSTYSNMQIRSVASKVSTSVNGDELTITVNEDLTGNSLAIYFPGYAEIENERTLSSSIISLSDSINSLNIRASQNPNNDFGSPSMVLTSDVPQRSMTFSEATSISGIGVTILNNGSNITSGTVFTIKGLKVSADARKIIPDASGNNYTVLAIESGNIGGTNEYWTGVVRGTSDNALSVTETALKKKPLTSLRFNVYGTDKKIIPGKYMRLIFSQDSNGNVTPTYISEEEWNDVYDV